MPGVGGGSSVVGAERGMVGRGGGVGGARTLGCDSFQMGKQSVNLPGTLLFRRSCKGAREGPVK